MEARTRLPNGGLRAGEVLPPGGRAPAIGGMAAGMLEPNEQDRDVVPGEDDVESDDAVARTRATGGGPSDEPDAGATTGTGESGTFVGRVAGQDVGYAGETGAERRAAAEQQDK
jgi:hypothetical protein